jgi:hypothetical protein
MEEEAHDAPPAAGGGAAAVATDDDAALFAELGVAAHAQEHLEQSVIDEVSGLCVVAGACLCARTHTLAPPTHVACMLRRAATPTVMTCRRWRRRQRRRTEQVQRDKQNRMQVSWLAL